MHAGRRFVAAIALVVLAACGGDDTSAGDGTAASGDATTVTTGGTTHTTADSDENGSGSCNAFDLADAEALLGVELEDESVGGSIEEGYLACNFVSADPEGGTITYVVIGADWGARQTYDTTASRTDAKPVSGLGDEAVAASDIVSVMVGDLYVGGSVVPPGAGLDQAATVQLLQTVIDSL